MTYGYYNSEKYCRWCGKPYTAEKPFGKDGFCQFLCKQAHYRAYKRYVTAKSSNSSGSATCPVTRKKSKK